MELNLGKNKNGLGTIKQQTNI